MIRTAALRPLASVAAIAVAVVAGAARAQELAGQASVIDGDTLEIHGARIRLWGIDAPEHDQLCRGDDSLPYRCGAAAANKLGAFIAHRLVLCVPKDTDRYGRTVATCRADAEDLGEWLVSEGLALDWPRYSKGRYSAAQREAERAGRGMWAGSYVEPWQYRACVRTGARPAECSDDAAARP
jgi:endonuclease YncB( thermonuclease family)